MIVGNEASSSVSAALLVLGAWGGAAALPAASLLSGPGLAVFGLPLSGARALAARLPVSPALLAVLERCREKTELE